MRSLGGTKRFVDSAEVLPVMTAVHVTEPDMDHARDLRRAILSLSRQRFDLAHECAHLLVEDDVAAFTECPEYAGGAGRTTSALWLFAPLEFGSNAAPALDQISIKPAWWPTTSAPIGPNASLLHSYRHLTAPWGPDDPNAWYRPSAIHERSIRLVDLPGVSSAVSSAALIRLIDGILAALGLILMRVLAALTRQPDAPILVLVMLAACLRFGRREEPEDGSFLPIRRSQTYLGSCLDA